MKMMLLAFAATTLAAAPLGAQASTAPAAGACEVHVFPAERFQAMTTGWLGAGLLNSAINARQSAFRRSGRFRVITATGP